MADIIELDFRVEYQCDMFLYVSDTETGFPIEPYNDFFEKESYTDMNYVRVNLQGTGGILNFGNLKFKAHKAFMLKYLFGGMFVTEFCSNRDNVILSDDTTDVGIGFIRYFSDDPTVTYPYDKMTVDRTNVLIPTLLKGYSKLLGYNREKSTWEFLSVHTYDVSAFDGENISKVVLFNHGTHNTDDLYFSAPIDNGTHNINILGHNKLFVRRKTIIHIPSRNQKSEIPLYYYVEFAGAPDVRHTYYYSMDPRIGDINNNPEYPLFSYFLEGYARSQVNVLFGFDKNSIFGTNRNPKLQYRPVMLMGTWNREPTRWISWNELEAPWTETGNSMLPGYIRVYYGNYGEILPYLDLVDSYDETGLGASENYKITRMTRFRGPTHMTSNSIHSDILIFFRASELINILDYNASKGNAGIDCLAFCLSNQSDIGTNTEKSDIPLLYFRLLEPIQFLTTESVRMLFRTGLVFDTNEQIEGDTYQDMDIPTVSNQEPLY